MVAVAPGARASVPNEVVLDRLVSLGVDAAVTLRGGLLDVRFGGADLVDLLPGDGVRVRGALRNSERRLGSGRPASVVPRDLDVSPAPRLRERPVRPAQACISPCALVVELSRVVRVRRPADRPSAAGSSDAGLLPASTVRRLIAPVMTRERAHKFAVSVVPCAALNATRILGGGRGSPGRAFSSGRRALTCASAGGHAGLARSRARVARDVRRSWGCPRGWLRGRARRGLLFSSSAAAKHREPRPLHGRRPYGLGRCREAIRTATRPDGPGQSPWLNRMG